MDGDKSDVKRVEDVTLTTTQVPGTAAVTDVVMAENITADMPQDAEEEDPSEIVTAIIEDITTAAVSAAAEPTDVTVAVSMETADAPSTSVTTDVIKAVEPKACMDSSASGDAATVTDIAGTVMDTKVVEPVTAEKGITETTGADKDIKDPATTDNDLIARVTEEANVTEHITADQNITEPVTAEKDITEPVTAEKDITEPVTTEKDITEPVTAEKDVTESVAARTDKITESVTAPVTEDKVMTGPVTPGKDIAESVTAEKNIISPVPKDSDIPAPVVEHTDILAAATKETAITKSAMTDKDSTAPVTADIDIIISAAADKDITPNDTSLDCSNISLPSFLESKSSTGDKFTGNTPECSYEKPQSPAVSSVKNSKENPVVLDTPAEQKASSSVDDKQETPAELNMQRPFRNIGVSENSSFASDVGKYLEGGMQGVSSLRSTPTELPSSSSSKDLVLMSLAKDAMSTPDDSLQEPRNVDNIEIIQLIEDTTSVSMSMDVDRDASLAGEKEHSSDGASAAAPVDGEQSTAVDTTPSPTDNSLPSKDSINKLDKEEEQTSAKTPADVQEESCKSEASGKETNVDQEGDVEMVEEKEGEASGSGGKPGGDGDGDGGSEKGDDAEKKDAKSKSAKKRRPGITAETEEEEEDNEEYVLCRFYSFVVDNICLKNYFSCRSYASIRCNIPGRCNVLLVIYSMCK